MNHPQLDFSVVGDKSVRISLLKDRQKVRREKSKNNFLKARQMRDNHYTMTNFEQNNKARQSEISRDINEENESSIGDSKNNEA